MNWKNILLTSVLTTGLSGFAFSDVQAAGIKTNKDTTPPMVPIFSVNKFINVSNENSFEIKGKGEANSTILITLKDGKTTLYVKSKADSKGNFKTKTNAKKLNEGKVIFSIQSMDHAGNKSKVKTQNLVKDVSIEGMSIDNEGFINALTQSEYPVSGTADIGSKIDVSIQSGKGVIAGKGTVDELGNYSIDLNITSLPDGKLKIIVKQSDTAGNVELQTVQVVKDTKAPSSPILFTPSVLQSETVTKYVVSGLGVKNGEVEITLTDGLNDVSSIASVDENGLFQVELNAASLIDGEITIIAKQMNQAGNESKETLSKTVKDTIVPVKPLLDPLPVITFVNQTEYTITGQGDKGATVQLLITDFTTTITASVVVDGEGRFSTKLNLSTLKSGNILVLANQLDLHKNPSTYLTTFGAKQ